MILMSMKLDAPNLRDITYIIKVKNGQKLQTTSLDDNMHVISTEFSTYNARNILNCKSAILQANNKFHYLRQNKSSLV